MNTEDTTPIQCLRKQAAFSLSLLAALNKEPLTTKRDLVLRHCVDRSVELAAGCVQLAEKQLPAATAVIARTLLTTVATSNYEIKK